MFAEESLGQEAVGENNDLSYWCRIAEDFAERLQNLNPQDVKFDEYKARFGSFLAEAHVNIGRIRRMADEELQSNSPSSISPRLSDLPALMLDDPFSDPGTQRYNPVEMYHIAQDYDSAGTEYRKIFKAYLHSCFPQIQSIESLGVHSFLGCVFIGVRGAAFQSERSRLFASDECYIEFAERKQPKAISQNKFLREVGVIMGSHEEEVESALAEEFFYNP